MHCVIILTKREIFLQILLDALTTQIDTRGTLCYAGDRRLLQERAMKNGYKAMDSDMHVMEPCDLWQKYIDKKFLDHAPIGLNRHKRDLGVQVEGKIMPRPTPKPNPELKPIRERILSEKYADEEARDFDNVAQLGAMDKEGLDVAILYPSRGLFVLAVDGLDPDLAAAIARAYNDWMHDFCKIAPDRMFGAAIVTPHDVSSAVEETRRVIKD